MSQRINKQEVFLFAESSLFSDVFSLCGVFSWSGNYSYVSDVFQVVCCLGVSASRRHPDVSCPPSSVSLCLQAWCWRASCSSLCVSGRRPRLTAGWTSTGICGRRLTRSCTEMRYVIKSSGCKYVRVFPVRRPLKIHMYDFIINLYSIWPHALSLCTSCRMRKGAAGNCGSRIWCSSPNTTWRLHWEFTRTNWAWTTWETWWDTRLLV